MPFFDGTGPLGEGPGTGRGLGPCPPISVRVIPPDDLSEEEGPTQVKDVIREVVEEEPVIEDPCYLARKIEEEIDEADLFTQSLIKLLKKDEEISQDVKERIAFIKKNSLDFLQKRLKILFDLIGKSENTEGE